MNRPTGYASPAQGYEEKQINLNEYLIKNPASTYFMDFVSCYLKDRGILPSSLIIIDKAIEPKHGSLVVASKDGQYVCMEYIIENGKHGLLDDKGKYFPSGDDDFIFGVIIGVINKFL
jgi:DNA polymerase V